MEAKNRKMKKGFIIEYSEFEGVFRVEPVWLEEALEDKDIFPLTEAGVAMINNYTLLTKTTVPVSECVFTKPFNYLYKNFKGGYYMLAKTESETVRDAIGIFFHYYETVKGE